MGKIKSFSHIYNSFFFGLLIFFVFEKAISGMCFNSFIELIYKVFCISLSIGLIIIYSRSIINLCVSDKKPFPVLKFFEMLFIKFFSCVSLKLNGFIIKLIIVSL